MRAARDARAIGIEPRADRRAFAAANAKALGAPALRLVEGAAPDALRGLPAPDAVFVGGGLSGDVFAAAWAALRPLGRFVANAVTLESEALLIGLQTSHGGDLARITVQLAEPVGSRRGWRPAMPVTQWSLVKR
jgi:precorrin-6Y C5,15-methyltransferase (decarboxylating)